MANPKQPNCGKIGTRLILGMAETREDEIRQLVDRVYRAESSRILATLIRLLGDFDLAEDAMQDAFAAALMRWSRDGWLPLGTRSPGRPEPTPRKNPRSPLFL